MTASGTEAGARLCLRTTAATKALGCAIWAAQSALSAGRQLQRMR